MANHVLPVVVNHVVLCWAGRWESWIERCASGCESCCAMVSKWLWIMANHVVPVVVNHVVLYWASRLESRCEPVPIGVNQGELCWSSGCESWCAMLYQWSWIMESYVQPVVVNHVICLANGCESWRIMLCQWLWIKLCYAEPVVGNNELNDAPVGVNYVVLCWACRCESRCAMLSQ
jgi:hypothetical protein